MKKKIAKELLDEICDTCSKDNYCLLKDLCSLSSLIDERFVVQMKCIEIFKYEESKHQDRNIEWNEATMMWAEQGYAEHFANIYDKMVVEGHTVHPRPTYKAIAQLVHKGKIK